ncbi:phosphatase PAP2 family protein [Methanobrevibacter sp.]|uniref:phosphatase PAP2 family protein n=1 Tax=Methanobrevibacter sp. TaxID=66852 RepID=UPI00388D60BF
MNLNTEIFYLINNDLSNPIFDLIMPQITNLGSFACLLILSILAILICRHYNKDRYLQISKLCLYAILVSAAIVFFLKIGIIEDRPFTTLSHVNQLVIPSEPNSFPSGHASSTFSVITVLIYEFRQNKLLVSILILFGILIAFSRVYCGVHYPLDVVAGAMIGILSAILVLKVKL